MQPIVGRYVLPWFGGIPSVWTTCMLFFQTLLLGGYLYSHILTTRLRPKTQATVQSFLVGIAAVLLGLEALLWKTPLLPGARWKPGSPDHPVSDLLILLTVCVGLPYIVLCTTGPLLQSWFSRYAKGKSPYRLYALSNLGSLLGLISYPILFEPMTGLHAQAWLWSIGYLVFLGGSLVCALELRKTDSRAEEGQNLQEASVGESASRTPPSAGTQILWFFLASLASVMLLATTNLICQDVAVVPFLWVLPLTLYLLSLVICFDNPKWYRREIFQTLFAVTLPFSVLALSMNSSQSGVVLIGIFSLCQFACCMVCHGELVRQKPEQSYLTRFYLIVAAGGAAGGMFVALIAPRIFSGYREFQCGLVGCIVAMIIVLMRDTSSWWYWPSPALGSLILVGLAATPHLYVRYMNLLVPPDAFYTFHYYGLLTSFLCVAIFLVIRGRKQLPKYRPLNLAQAASTLVLIGVVAALAQQMLAQRKGEIRKDRNFYGSLTIYSRKAGNNQTARLLMHGQTSHGYQILQDPRKPGYYYGARSGLGLLMAARPACEGLCRQRYGVIGLGAGMIAAYGRPGEYIRAYEINPQIIEYSTGKNPYFSFVRDSAAKVEIVPGDARLSLERELKASGSNKFDVLIVDAFNSDSIPVHLLTREVVNTYLSHLRSPDSVLVFHVSNHVLDLHPVLLGLALQNHLYCVRLHKDLSTEPDDLSDWVMMARNPDALKLSTFAGHLAPMPPADKSIVWTDDYSNLFHVLRIGNN
jgi:hypothetical protein